MNYVIGLYIIAFILFIFASFEVTFGRAPGWSLKWEWLAFAALVLSLVV